VHRRSLPRLNAILDLPWKRVFVDAVTCTVHSDLSSDFWMIRHIVLLILARPAAAKGDKRLTFEQLNTFRTLHSPKRGCWEGLGGPGSGTVGGDEAMEHAR